MGVRGDDVECSSPDSDEEPCTSPTELQREAIDDTPLITVVGVADAPR